MKVLAFAATNSRDSINRALLEYAATRLRTEFVPEAQVEFLDINDFEMPIYSVDREREGGIPAQARDFFDRIGTADALLVSFAEHNGFVTAAWKNVFDWMSRIRVKLWQDKPMVILAASPGPRGGAGVLASQEMLTPHFGGELRGKHGIGKWSEAWDAETRTLTRAEDVAALGEALAGLEAPADKAEAA